MEITTSPPFTGGAFLTPICGPDGTAALPTYSFCSDLNTGIYLSAADEMSITTGGIQRFVVDASGNVGIGITAPDGRLHVHTASAGAVTPHTTADELVVENSASGGISVLVPNSGTANVAFGSPANNYASLIQWDYTNSAFNIASNDVGAELVLRSSNFVEAMRIDSSQNVGIGIATPDGTLHVHTASAGGVTAWSAANQVIAETSGNGGISVLTPDASTSRLVFGSPTSNRGSEISWTYNSNLMSVGTQNAGGEVVLKSANAVEAIRIDSSQNVGIGTSSPNERLEIASSTDPTIRITNTSTALVATESLGQLEFYGNDATSPGAGVKSFLQSICEGGSGTKYGLSFGTTDTSASVAEAMRIDGVGNVGIGTAAPNTSAILDLSSTTKGFSPPAMTTTQRDLISTPPAGLQIFNTTTSSTQEYTGAIWQNIGASGTADPLLLGSGAPGTPTYSFSADSTTGMYYNGSNALAFTANGTRAMVIDSTQNVGIGIATPDGRLHVHSATAGVVSAPASASNLVIEDSGNMGVTLLCPDANTSTIVFGTVTDNLGADINWDYTNSLYSIRTAKAGASLRFATANGTEAMRIDSSQNVGIGITAPDGRLHVHTATAGVVTANGEADDLIIENSAASGLSILSPASSSSSIFLGNVNNSSEGRIKYISGASSNTGRMEIWAGGATAVDIGNDLHVDIKDSLSVNTPTGGDKGAGSINAKAIYDDGEQVAPFNVYRAHLGSTQSINTGAPTKVQFDTEDIDTNGDYDPTTNYRFTPTITGKYSITANLQFTGTLEDQKDIRVNISKNGTIVGFTEVHTSDVNTGVRVMVTDIVDLNGSTDYIEIYADHTFTTAENIGTNSYVCGHMVGI